MEQRGCMKFVLVLLLSFLLNCGPIPKIQPSPINQEVLWREFNILALTEARINHHDVVMVFTKDKCSLCNVMKEITFKDPRIIELLNKEFVPALLDDEKYFDLLDTFGLDRRWPTIVLLSPEGEMITSFQGFVSPDVFTIFLEKLLLAQKQANLLNGQN